MPQKSILSLGQCGYDDSRLAQLAAAAGANLSRASTPADAHRRIAASPPDLILINRIFDDTGDSGVDLVATLRPTGIPLMLVSDYADAQAAALANGALAGFGKSQLQDPATLEKICQALATERPT